MPNRPEKWKSDVPARMDRLPWGRWHWRVVTALGVTWIIDGLEVTLVGTIGGVLTSQKTLGLNSTQVGNLGTAYLLGAVIGALVFGDLTDRFGRKKLFAATLGVYLVGAFFSAFAWDFWSFALFRFITGAGIGGEYSAINSAIDELIPARLRGRVDLAVNGTYWVGAAAGSVASLALLDPRFFPIDVGWRVGFGVGALFGLVIIFYRNHVPESPRWLASRGMVDEADAVVSEIEKHFADDGVELEPATGTVSFKRRGDMGYGLIARTMAFTYPGRSVFALSLMIAQAFLYNAVFFTYSQVLEKYLHVVPDRAGIFLLPFAATNFLGPVLLGGLFDTWGRKPMIVATFTASAALLTAMGWMFSMDMLSATTMTLFLAVVFFFASPAASSAYLTVSEIFPLEMRGLAIALYYAVGTALGGTVAPSLFGRLIDTGERSMVFVGYAVAAGLMMVAVGCTAAFGVKAEGAALESVASPLSADDDGD